MGGEDFSLKWNDHHSVFFSSAEQLCRGEILTDVTLSCGNVDFDAHKLVLSVCSGYFASIFSRNTDKHKNSHTIVYLKGVEPRHMELILSYMYRGEINVEETELVSLLATAKGLQIKGLADSNDDTTSTSPKRSKYGRKNEDSETSKSGKRQKDNYEDLSGQQKRIKEEDAPILPEDHVNMELHEGHLGPLDTTGYPVAGHHNVEDQYRLPEGAYVHEPQPEGQSAPHKHKAGASGFGSGSQQGQQQGSKLEQSEKFICHLCDKRFHLRWMLERHQLTHTGEQNFACAICWRRFSLQQSCVRHVKNVHKDAGQQNPHRLVVKIPAQQPQQQPPQPATQPQPPAHPAPHPQHHILSHTNGL